MIQKSIFLSILVHTFVFISQNIVSRQFKTTIAGICKDATARMATQFNFTTNLLQQVNIHFGLFKTFTVIVLWAVSCSTLHSRNWIPRNSQRVKQLAICLLFTGFLGELPNSAAIEVKFKRSFTDIHFLRINRFARELICKRYVNCMFNISTLQTSGSFVQNFMPTYPRSQICLLVAQVNTNVLYFSVYYYYDYYYQITCKNEIQSTKALYIAVNSMCKKFSKQINLYDKIRIKLNFVQESHHTYLRGFTIVK